MVITPRRTSARQVLRMRQTRNANNILVRKHDGKRLLGRSGLRWKDIVKVNVQDTVAASTNKVKIIRFTQQVWNCMTD